LLVPRKHPAILPMLQDGRLHLSVIAKLAPVLTEANRDDLLARAKHKTKRKIEELVAEIAPKPDVPSTMRKLPVPREPSKPVPAVELRPDAVEAAAPPKTTPVKPAALGRESWINTDAPMIMSPSLSRLLRFGGSSSRVQLSPDRVESPSSGSGRGYGTGTNHQGEENLRLSSVFANLRHRRLSMLSLIVPIALAVMIVVPPVAKDELAITHPLSDEDIAQALAVGKDVSKKLPRLYLGAAGSNFGGMRDDSNRNNNFMQHQTNLKNTGFGVEIYTPYGWIAKLSRDAAMRGKELLPRHLTERLLEPVVRVVCHSSVPQEVREGAYGNAVLTVSMVSANKKVTAQIEPLRTRRISDKIRAPSGELVDMGPLVASFDLGQLMQLSARDKKGEFFVTIVADNGETKRFKVKSKHFKNLL